MNNIFESTDYRHAKKRFLLFKLHTFCYASIKIKHNRFLGQKHTCVKFVLGLVHTRSYHRVLCFYGLDLQIVLDSSSRAVGFEFLLRRSARKLGPRFVLSIFLGRMRSGWQVTALFLGDVSFGAVDGFDVFPERAGIGVALRAARDLTHVGFLQR